MDDRLYFLGFSVFPGIGPKTFQKLLAEFGSAKSAWGTTARSGLAGLIGEKTLARFEDFRNTFSPQDYAKKLQEKDVSFLCLTDKGYPQLLKEIKNPPIVLYVKGEMGALVAHENFLVAHAKNQKIKTRDFDSANSHNENFVVSPRQLENQKLIAVVGTRKITQYGREVTEMFTRDLVAAGFGIVSGLAMGVDAVAHQVTIDNGGKTIAVLGCGVDCCTPAQNQHIYNSIVNGNGCVLSEFPLGQPPTIGSFPSRNRIIAGLSMGTLVTEGAEDSGALITADCAFQNNRKVFAVPGPITSGLSKGPYKLLEKGAKMVTSAQDILREFKIQDAPARHWLSPQATAGGKNETATEEEKKILEILENEQFTFDEIVRQLQLDSSIIGSTLSLMEVKGMIKSLDGGFFRLA